MNGGYFHGVKKKERNKQTNKQINKQKQNEIKPKKLSKGQRSSWLSGYAFYVRKIILQKRNQMNQQNDLFDIGWKGNLMYWRW